MRSWKYIIAVLLLAINIVCPVCAQTSVPFSETPPNFKIAFIGDQGLGENAEAGLTLIKSEGAQAILHQGDLDYENNPPAWEAQINKILGPDFPYFASVGNHDTGKWNGENGYQQYLKNRLNRLGITWDGDLGVKSSIKYKGIFIIQVSPGDFGFYHAAYIREQLAEDKSIWRICCWHRNMRLMQVGGKKDDTGWGVYEEARKGGQELDKGPRIPIISEFVEAELERLGSKKPDGNSFRPDTEKLDELFRWSLEIAWAKTAA
mgnify:CR=1 FL=1